MHDFGLSVHLVIMYKVLKDFFLKIIWCVLFYNYGSFQSVPSHFQMLQTGILHSFLWNDIFLKVKDFDKTVQVKENVF